MSDTIIQIKRSTTTGTPANLQPGELAYTSNGEVLFIGSVVGTDVANVVAIAGQRNPGVLTANQALVANSSSWIDNVQTAKLIIGTTGETANITAFTTDGTLSGANVSNSTIMSSWAVKDYVDNNSAATLEDLDDVDVASRANNNILVYDAGTSKWENHTISGTANQINVVFTSQDISLVLPDNVDIVTSLDVGANVNLTTTGINVGNSSVNTFINATSVSTNTVVAANIVSTGNTTVQGNLIADGNVQLGNNTSDIVSIIGQVNTSIVPTANVTYSLGTDNNRWQNVYTQELNADTGVFAGEVTVSGNLTVLGDLLTVNVSTLAVEDPLIQLATNNTIGDTVDIGFFGSYNVGGGSHEHTGFFRDATDGVYKIFAGLEPSPTTTVDTSNNTYTTGTLEAYLNSGGLISNTTAVAITANSTINVSIVANSITLSTALGVPSGGTGQASFANNGVLYGNTAGALSVTAAGANGNVLKVVNNVPAFGMLDGGTF